MWLCVALPFFIDADFSALLRADVVDRHEVAAVDELLVILHHEPEHPVAPGFTYNGSIALIKKTMFIWLTYYYKNVKIDCVLCD